MIIIYKDKSEFGLSDKDTTSSILFSVNNETWECKTIPTIIELVEKIEAYGNRDEYVRELEDRIKHLESIL